MIKINEDLELVEAIKPDCIKCAGNRIWTKMKL